MNKIYRLCRFDWPLHFTLLLTNWLPDNVMFLRLRGYLIKPFFKKCGNNLRVGRNNTFYNSYNIILGDNVFIAYGNWFSGATDITVESDVMFGPNSIIISGNHSRINGSYRYGKSILIPIRIGYGCWIGANSAILAGSNIGRGSVVAANTVVRDHVPDNCLFAGNPGKIKKYYNE